VVVNIFLTSTTVVLNHFVEWSRIQTYKFLDSRTRKFYNKTIDKFCFIVLTKSVTQNCRGVTERHCPSKGILSQQRFRHYAITEYLFCLRSRHLQLLFK